MLKTKNNTALNLVNAALCLALAFVLPLVTAQIPQVGSALLPMHLPVLLCGYVAGWPYGLLIGFVAPILRSLLFGMPPMYPTAVAMAAELAAYGCLTGVLYRVFGGKKGAVYLSLIGAMLGGRAVWGVARALLAGLGGSTFSLALFVAGGFTNAVPGIVMQLVLIPLIVLALRRAGVLRDGH